MIARNNCSRSLEIAAHNQRNAHSAPRPIRMLTPSISTSMLPAVRSPLGIRWCCRLRESRDGNPVSTTAGTNCGSLLSGLTRACRRQVNTCCGVSPCWRAISETTASGASVSSTTRALKAAANLRRRPVPVITSSRRTSVTSGSSLWSSIDTSRSPIQRSASRPSHGVRKGGIKTALTINQKKTRRIYPSDTKAAVIIARFNIIASRVSSRRSPLLGTTVR